MPPARGTRKEATSTAYKGRERAQLDSQQARSQPVDGCCHQRNNEAKNTNGLLHVVQLYIHPFADYPQLISLPVVFLSLFFFKY